MDIDSIRSPGSDSRDQIVLALRRRGVLSRADIARATGLAKSTVSELVGDLIDAGIVVNAAEVSRIPRAKHSGQGLTLNPAAGGFVGVDFGFRHLRVVLADASHRIVARRERFLGPDYSSREGMRAAQELVAETVEQGGLTRKSVLGVGIALPGLVDPVTGDVRGTSVLPWSESDVNATLSEMLQQHVLIENESNCAALGEYRWGSGRGAGTMVYLKLHSGVGGAILVGGEILHGTLGAAGELGHITVDRSGALCRCGGRGCLETRIGVPAVLRAIHEVHGPAVTLQEMLTMLASGDHATTRLFAEVGEQAGQVLGEVSNVVAPDRVIVGGALAAGGAALLEPLVRSYATHSLMGREARDGALPTRIALGSLGADASALGAVALVLERLGLARQ